MKCHHYNEELIYGGRFKLFTVTLKTLRLLKVAEYNDARLGRPAYSKGTGLDPGL
jgi:hypothetical protein